MTLTDEEMRVLRGKIEQDNSWRDKLVYAGGDLVGNIGVLGSEGKK